MKIAYIVFDQLTVLDLIGIYDPVSRLKTQGHLHDLSWDICAFTPSVTDAHGLKIIPDSVRLPLSDYDAVIVPGGYGTRSLMNDPDFIKWLQTISPHATKISVCTGSLLLGAAGFLKGRTATTHFNELETLKPFCSKVVSDRVVEDGDVISAGAVASSLDLGLYLCRKWAGEQAREQIKKGMDYHG